VFGGLDDPRFERGVFQRLVCESGDSHLANVLIHASAFDFQFFHKVDCDKNMCTLSDKGDPWIQFELVKGSAIISGYRFVQIPTLMFDRWSLQGSNDCVKWTVLDRPVEDQSKDALKVRRCESIIAFRYFRLVYETITTGKTRKLRARHFDIFGVYFDHPGK
jgi:hypothetical protein